VAVVPVACNLDRPLGLPEEEIATPTERQTPAAVLVAAQIVAQAGLVGRELSF
jgi:hypothetical protein